MMSQTIVPVSSGPDRFRFRFRFRFRWTIARKIAGLVLLAVGLLAGVGLLAATSAATRQRLAGDQASTKATSVKVSVAATLVVAVGLLTAR
jgi:uncharacterized membrane protein YjgN (DUF898 family)